MGRNGSPKLHSSNHKRLSHTIRSETTTCCTKSAKKSLEYPTLSYHDTNYRADEERASFGGSGTANSKFSFNNIPSSEGRPFLSPHFQPQDPKCLCFNRAVQANKYGSRAGLPTAARLVMQNRYFSGLLPRGHNQSTKTVSPVNLRRGALGDDMSSVWLKYSPESFRFHNELGRPNSKTAGNTHNRFHRRFFASSPGCYDANESSVQSSRNSQIPGVANKCQKMPASTSKAHCLFGHSLGPLVEPQMPPSGETSRMCQQDCAGSSKKNSNSKRASEPRRLVKFCKFCSAKRQAELPPSSRVPKHHSQNLHARGLCLDGGMSIESNVVASKLQNGVSNSLSHTDSLSNNRRIGYSVGCQTEQLVPLRDVERSGAGLTQQSKRITRCPKSLTNQLSVTNKLDNTIAMRQQNNGCLPSQSGWNQISVLNGLDLQGVRNSRSVPNTFDSPLSARKVQRPRRFSFSPSADRRMASSASLHTKDLRQVRHSSDRFVCLKNGTCRCQLCIARHDRRSGNIPRRFLQNMGLSPCMDFPPSFPYSEDTNSLKPSEGVLPFSGPSVGTSILEGRPQAESNRAPIHNNEPLELSGGHRNSTTSPQGRRDDNGGVEMWGWSENLKDWNPEQVELLQSAWRTSTRKTYKAPWFRWLKWAGSQGINPMAPEASYVAKFLADLFLVEKLSYNTILLHKSVISTLCNANESGKISNHPLIKHILKSIALKQPVARKSYIWNIDDLLVYLANSKIDCNNMFETSRHTAILLLLCSGRRIHDLTLLNVDSKHMIESDNSIILWPSFGSKTDSAKYQQSGWKILHNSVNKNLDPVYWVNRTKNLMNDRRNEAKCNNLFITLKGTPKPASRTLIAGWVKSILVKAGIIASPGSCRSAVASKSWSNNLPIDEILAKGNWRSENTFKKFYKREVMPVSCSTSIMNLFKPVM